MPPPLAPHKRAAILRDIEAARADGKSAGRIARAHGVARSTVTKIAAETGNADAFERTQTLKGARAKQIDNKAKRAQLQSDLLDDAQRVRARIWGPCKVVVGGQDGAEIVELDEAPLEGIKAGFTAIGIIIDKDRAYEKDAASSGSAAHAESVMGRLAVALTEAFGDEVAQETPQDDDD